MSAFGGKADKRLLTNLDESTRPSSRRLDRALRWRLPKRNCGGKARIESEVRDQSAQLVSGDTVLARPAQVSGQFLEARRCHEGGNRDKAAVALRQVGVIPHPVMKGALDQRAQLWCEGPSSLTRARIIYGTHVGSPKLGWVLNVRAPCARCFSRTAVPPHRFPPLVGQQ